MEEKKLKTAKAYSLDPDVIVWVKRKAGMKMMAGESGSESLLVNEILKAEMEKEKAEKGKKK